MRRRSSAWPHARCWPVAGRPTSPSSWLPCEAALDPAFNLNGQAVTTQPAGQLVVVNGPIRDALGFNGGMGALGPGSRANLTIGRALRLRRHAHRRRAARAARPRDARASRQARILHRRGRGGQSLAAAARRARLRSETVGRDADRLRRAALDLRPPLDEPGRARLGARLGGGDDVEPELVAAGRHVRLCRCVPSTRALFASAGWSKEQRARRDVRRRRAGPRASCSAARRRRRRPPPIPTRSLTKWTSPEEIVLIAAGGEAGRYSALLGPCLGMDAAIVSREVVE